MNRMKLLENGSLLLAAVAFAVLLLVYKPSAAADSGSLGLGARLFVAVLMVALLGATMIIEDRQWQGVVSRAFGTVSLGVALLSFFAWHQYGSAQPVPPDGTVFEEGFFTTIGQVLPVILLAALVDVRRSDLRVQRTGGSEVAQTLSYLGVIAVGEFWTLFALWTDDLNDPFYFAVASAATTGGIVGLAIALIGPSREPVAAGEP